MTPKNLLPGAALAFLILAPACRPARPALGPVPEEIRSIEGFASVRMIRGGASAKARLAWLFAPPDRARVQALGPLNRLLFEVSAEGPEAVLILPSKKAYWKGPRTEVLEAGLGFSIGWEEIVGLLTGRWEGAAAGWALERAGDGRVVGGRREGLAFRVEEFFASSRAARVFSFQAPASAGTLTVLSLDFNTADPAARAGSSIPPGYARVERAEMERLLRDED